MERIAAVVLGIIAIMWLSERNEIKAAASMISDKPRKAKHHANSVEAPNKHSGEQPLSDSAFTGIDSTVQDLHARIQVPDAGAMKRTIKAVTQEGGSVLAPVHIAATETTKPSFCDQMVECI